MEYNREDLAWAAGFADGEAHIGITKTSKTGKRPCFVICQTEDGPLERFRNIIGMGKIYGPYAPKIAKTNRKPYKQFHIHTFEEVQQTICMLFPWLSAPKRKQALNTLHAYSEFIQSRRAA